MARLILEKTSDGVELVEFALRVWRGQDPEMKDPKSRQWAHEWLSDRGLGKAVQSVEMTFENGPPPLDFSGLSDAELAALAKLDQQHPPAPEAGDGSVGDG